MPQPLRIIFAGTPDLAKSVLEHILHSGFSVGMVLTKPDRPSGRGKKITQSPVKVLALEQHIPVLQPVSFKNDATIIDLIREFKPDIMVVVAYGLILPQELLDIPRLGCVNVHVSLLPRHRGAAPIARAILAGDCESGVTIMQMDCGLDTGAILLQEKVIIESSDTALELHDKLAILGSRLIVEYLTHYTQIKPVLQTNDGATYAHKIEKSEAKINWQNNAYLIERQIRGFNPAPGCFSILDGVLIKIWQSSVGDATTAVECGTIIAIVKDGIIVACGEGTTLVIKQLQEAGGKRQLAKDYILGRANLVGKVFLHTQID